MVIAYFSQSIPLLNVCLKLVTATVKKPSVSSMNLLLLTLPLQTQTQKKLVFLVLKYILNKEFFATNPLHYILLNTLTSLFLTKKVLTSILVNATRFIFQMMIILFDTFRKTNRSPVVLLNIKIGFSHQIQLITLLPLNMMPT